MSIQYYRTEKGRQELVDRSVRLNARQRALLLMIESEEANSLLRNQIEKLATPENLAQLVEHGLIESIGGVLPEQDVLSQLAVPDIASNEAEFAEPPVTATTHHEAEAVATPVPPAASEAVVVLPVTPALQQVASSQVAIQTVVPVVAATVQAVVPAEMPVLPPVLTSLVEAGRPVVGPLFDASEVPDIVLSLDEVKVMMVASLRRYCGLLAAPLVRDIEKAATAGQLRMCQMRWVTLLTESRAGAHNIAMWKEQINDNLKNLA